MYRYATDDQWSELEVATAREEAAARTRAQRVAHLLLHARRALASTLSCYFESFIFVEKLLLVVALRMVAASSMQALAQGGCYLLMSALVLLVWPCQQLDVRIHLFAWSPYVPPSRVLEPSAPAWQSGWRRKRGWGYILKSHVVATVRRALLLSLQTFLLFG